MYAPTFIRGMKTLNKTDLKNCIIKSILSVELNTEACKICNYDAANFGQAIIWKNVGNPLWVALSGAFGETIHSHIVNYIYEFQF